MRAVAVREVVRAEVVTEAETEVARVVAEALVATEEATEVVAAEEATEEATGGDDGGGAGGGGEGGGEGGGGDGGGEDGGCEGEAERRRRQGGGDGGGGDGGGEGSNGGGADGGGNGGTSGAMMEVAWWYAEQFRHGDPLCYGHWRHKLPENIQCTQCQSMAPTFASSRPQAVMEHGSPGKAQWQGSHVSGLALLLVPPHGAWHVELTLCGSANAKSAKQSRFSSCPQHNQHPAPSMWWEREAGSVSKHVPRYEILPCIFIRVRGRTEARALVRGPHLQKHAMDARPGRRSVWRSPSHLSDPESCL